MTDDSQIMEELDETDMQILHILQENTTISHEEMGTRVSLSESTVRYRIKKLQELGVILGFTCAVDLRKLGYNLTVFANIDVDAGKEQAVVKRLTKLPNVIGLFTALGSPDMVSLMVARNNEELAEIVEKIRAMKEVRKMACILALKTHKWECTMRIPVEKPRSSSKQTTQEEARAPRNNTRPKNWKEQV